MDLKELIAEYLKEPRVMQLATVRDNKPWVCNLHYYVDSSLNFYWISTQTRRHSKDIEQNPCTAVAITVHEDTPEENYIVGITAEGEARLLSEERIKVVGLEYVQKLEKSSTLLEDILTAKNPHKFYVLKPTKIVLFDNKNFPDNPRQELVLK